MVTVVNSYPATHATCSADAMLHIISVTALAAWCLLVWDRRSVERLPPYLAGLLSGMRRQSVPDVARSMLPYKLDTMLPRVAATHRTCFAVCMQQHAAHRRAAAAYGDAYLLF